MQKPDFLELLCAIHKRNY